MAKFGLKLKYRPYMCLNCGNIQQEQTNHTSSFAGHCKNCSWKPSWTEKGFIHTELGGSPMRRKFVYYNDSKKNLVKKYSKESPNSFGGR